MDGELGAYLARKTEERIGYRILGWFENGFRHISNRLRPIRMPADMKDMRIRVLPSDVQARTFELLGAVPLAAPRNWPPALAAFWLVPFTVPCTLRFEYTVSAPLLPLSASGAKRGSEGMGPFAKNASSK